MSFCGTSGKVTSDSQLARAFQGSILPAIGSGRITEGELKGRLSAQKLEDVYNTMVASGDLLSNTAYKNQLKNTNTSSTALNNVGEKEAATMRKIQQEFCHYYFRYQYCLETLFDKLVTTSKLSNLTSADKDDIQMKLNRAKDYNEKLNDLIQITNYIAKKRASEMREQNDEINSMNANLKSTFDALQGHKKLLDSETSISELRKRMVEYTEEKNRSALNLLSLYGFLNLVAIGLLFYIARS